jgi:hypothetical protein
MSMCATAVPSRQAIATITAAALQDDVAVLNCGQPLAGYSAHDQVDQGVYINGPTANPTLMIVALALRQPAISRGR